MNKLFKKHLALELPAFMRECADGFALLSAKEIKAVPGASAQSIALAIRPRGELTQFVHFVAALKSDSQLTVEIGQFAGAEIPRAGIGSANLAMRLRSGEACPPVFAVRLFFLCEDRGNAERFWDLYLRESRRENESYSAYASRIAFAAVDEKIRVMSSGGPTEQYARESVRTVLEDVSTCLRERALPLLNTCG